MGNFEMTEVTVIEIIKFSIDSERLMNWIDFNGSEILGFCGDDVTFQSF
jgi:hypothetical protein